MQANRKLIQYIRYIVSFLLFSIAYSFAFSIRFYFLKGGVVSGDYFMLYGVMALIYLLILYINDTSMLSGENSFWINCMQVFREHLYLGLLLFAFLFIVKSGISYSRLHVFLVLVISWCLSASLGWKLQQMLLSHYKNGEFGEKIIVVTTEALADTVINQLKGTDNWYYNIAGLCLLDGTQKEGYRQNVKILAHQQNILDVILRENVDSVFICDAGDDIQKLKDLVQALQEAGITAHVRIHEAEFTNGFKKYDTFGDYKVMTYTQQQQDVRLRILVRFFDVTLGCFGCIIAIITYPLIALLIKLSSHGPVGFGYTRVGRNGVRFHTFCYRTICLIDDKLQQTRIGKVLEYTGMQNLWLSFHLLRGDISIIGNRAPSLPEFMSYSVAQRKSVCIKPGIFTTWVVGSPFDEREQKNLMLDWHAEQQNLFETIHTQQVMPKTYSASQIAYHHVKRVFDIFVSIVALIVLSPLFLLLSIAVFCCDGHNPIYAQLRIGKDGKKIRVYKFRSMRYHSDDLERLLTPEQLEQYKKEYKLVDDPRITTIGRLLRRFSLDELPQLVNVLKGDIALIGPRPIVEKETLFYGDKIRVLLSVKPGLTGYWQAYARNNATYETGERQKMELLYIEKESFIFDCKIILKTITAVLTGRGAY